MSGSDGEACDDPAHPSGEMLPDLTGGRLARLFLDGVNATALALMAGVTLQLTGDAFVDPITVGLAVLALLLQWRTRLSTVWFIAVAAAIGLVRAALSY